MTVDIIDPALERSELYKINFPEKAKIIEEYEREMNKASNKQETSVAIAKACKKLNLENDIELEKEIIKYYGEDPSDIYFFEKLFKQKY